MDIVTVITSQGLAALAMLKQCIVRCPAALWDAPGDATPVWRVIYHALFYVHLYAQPTEADFHPWPAHRKGLNRLDDDAVTTLTQAEMLDYCAFCEREFAARVAAIPLDAPSGFEWLPFSKGETHLYSIRHTQQHAGELMERLGRHVGEPFRWVGIGG